jgi:hypothetical protein
MEAGGLRKATGPCFLFPENPRVCLLCVCSPLRPCFPTFGKSGDFGIDPLVGVSIIRPSLSADVWRVKFARAIQFGESGCPEWTTSQKNRLMNSGAVVRSIALRHATRLLSTESSGKRTLSYRELTRMSTAERGLFSSISKGHFSHASLPSTVCVCCVDPSRSGRVQLW